MDWTKPELVSTIAAGVGIGIVIGWVVRGKYRSFSTLARRRITKPEEFDHSDNASQSQLSDDLSDDGEYKMVIVVRTDLKMGKGKAAAQCAHGALAAAEKAIRSKNEAFEAWKNCGQPKVVVKTDSEESLILLSRSAASCGLTYSIIRDAGRTQIASGSKTVLAVGPGPARLIDQVTGHLKLY